MPIRRRQTVRKAPAAKIKKAPAIAKPEAAAYVPLQLVSKAKPPPVTQKPVIAKAAETPPSAVISVPVHIHMPEQPAPVVHAHVTSPDVHVTAPEVTVENHNHVEAPRPVAVKVETAADGSRRYVPEVRS